MSDDKNEEEYLDKLLKSAMASDERDEDILHTENEAGDGTDNLTVPEINNDEPAVTENAASDVEEDTVEGNITEDNTTEGNTVEENTVENTAQGISTEKETADGINMQDNATDEETFTTEDIAGEESANQETEMDETSSDKTDTDGNGNESEAADIVDGLKAIVGDNDESDINSLFDDTNSDNSGLDSIFDDADALSENSPEYHETGSNIGEPPEMVNPEADESPEKSGNPDVADAMESPEGTEDVGPVLDDSAGKEDVPADYDEQRTGTDIDGEPDEENDFETGTESDVRMKTDVQDKEPEDVSKKKKKEKNKKEKNKKEKKPKKKFSLKEFFLEEEEETEQGSDDNQKLIDELYDGKESLSDEKPEDVGKKKKPKKEKKPKEKKPREKKQKAPKQPKQPKASKRSGEKLPVGGMIKAFVIAAVIAAIVILGSRIFSYKNSLSTAKEYYSMGKYAEAYDVLAGMKIGASDRDFYRRTEAVMMVYQGIESYENNMTVHNTAGAIDALVQAAGRKSKYADRITQCGADEDADQVYGRILELLSQYGISEEQALDYYSMTSHDKYYDILESYGGTADDSNN